MIEILKAIILGIVEGIIPAIIARYRMDDPDVSDEKLIEGLLTAVGVGKIIGRFANFSGAEGGCQAECGSAAWNNYKYWVFI